MKVFDKTEGFSDKVNFVDINNVFVGYELYQDCCENADWFISTTLSKDPYDTSSHVENPDLDLEPYSFDPNYLQELEAANLDEGRMVAFRLIAKGKPDLYLHLYNSHNGYYSHGFQVKHGDTVVQEDYL